MASSETTEMEIIMNPVTGDRMTFVQSSMAETFTVISGCLEMEMGQKGNRRRLQAGERLQVPARTHHSFCNSSREWVTFTTENRPATGFEQFLRGLYGLAIDGKVNSAGMPTNLLQLAVLLKLSDTVPVGAPLQLFNLLINTLVWVGQQFQVETSLRKYWHKTERHEQ